MKEANYQGLGFTNILRLEMFLSDETMGKPSDLAHYYIFNYLWCAETLI